LTLAIAEFFRDEDRTCCADDSVTRFAWPSAEIGLSAGEPPPAKGYTPTVFIRTPKLLERRSRGRVAPSPASLRCWWMATTIMSDRGRGQGILDGHIVMQRSIAERVVFPRSTFSSRLFPHHAEISRSGLSADHHPGASGHGNLCRHGELIRLGAYRAGSSARSMRRSGCMTAWGFLRQAKDEVAA